MLLCEGRCQFTVVIWQTNGLEISVHVYSHMLLNVTLNVEIAFKENEKQAVFTKA